MLAVVLSTLAAAEARGAQIGFPGETIQGATGLRGYDDMTCLDKTWGNDAETIAKAQQKRDRKNRQRAEQFRRHETSKR